MSSGSTRTGKKTATAWVVALTAIGSLNGRLAVTVSGPHDDVVGLMQDG